MSNFSFLKSNVQQQASVKTVVILDGAELPTFEKFHKKIAELLKFPDYYGNNLDALDEVLSDMAFSPIKNLLIVLRNYDALVHEEPHEKKIGLIQVLNNALEFWKKNGSRVFNVSFEPSKTARQDVKAAEKNV